MIHFTYFFTVNWQLAPFFQAQLVSYQHFNLGLTYGMIPPLDLTFIIFRDDFANRYLLRSFPLKLDVD
jgi:hypothetical protein